MKLLRPKVVCNAPPHKRLRKEINLFNADGVIYYNVVECMSGKEIVPKTLYEPKYKDIVYGDYVEQGVQYLEPMNAKEVQDPEKLEQMFNSADYIVEDKLDGTRALIHFDKNRVTGEYTTRVFSRRVSVKTQWLSENSDLLPQISLMNIPELEGTVIDGELRMPGYEFKEVSSTLNCTWDKAVHRQMEMRMISLYAFDVLKFKGEDVTQKPLVQRKLILEEVLDIISKHYRHSCISKLAYYDGTKISVQLNADLAGMIQHRYATYPRLAGEIQGLKATNYYVSLSRKAYYEYVVFMGGEGVMIKPKNGVYICGARKDNFMKVKKFLTKDLIIIGFTEPTREYKGKAPKDWEYYEGDTPVTKHYYYKQVGNLALGVLIEHKDYDKLPKNKKGDVYVPSSLNIQGFDDTHYVMEVCECSGMTDGERSYMTDNKLKLIGTVVEVKCNEIFKDSGRLRHPRFMRLRPDKSATQCTFHDHIFA